MIEPIFSIFILLGILFFLVNALLDSDGEKKRDKEEKWRKEYVETVLKRTSNPDISQYPFVYMKRNGTIKRDISATLRTEEGWKKLKESIPNEFSNEILEKINDT